MRKKNNNKALGRRNKDYIPAKRHNPVLFFCKGNNLYIEVCDTGQGVKKGNEEKIFDMRLSSTGGSGIGLYHAKWALKQLKGEIKLIKETNDYSTISGVYLLHQMWLFVILKENRYGISSAYDINKMEDLQYIFKMLKAQKEMIFEIVRKE